MKNQIVNFQGIPRGGIHTICIISSGALLPNPNKHLMDCITKYTTPLNPKTGEITTKAVINVNKWTNWCNSIEEYYLALDELFKEIGISEFTTVRVDFAFDYFEDNYASLHKLHKCICLMASLAYSMKNKYESYDPLALEHLTTRVQNEYIELENYNKDIESDGKSPISNRLELRSKGLQYQKSNYQGFDKLINDWFIRFGKFEKQFKLLQNECNKYLVILWNKEKDIKVKTLSEFIRKYQDNIYTKNQLLDFYSILGKKNPKGSFKYFMKNNDIVFISEKDIHSYFELLKQSMNVFLSKGVKIAPTDKLRESA